MAKDLSAVSGSAGLQPMPGCGEIIHHLGAEMFAQEEYHLISNSLSR